MEIERIEDCTVAEMDLRDSTALMRVLGPELYAAVNTALFENLLNVFEGAECGRSRGDDLLTLFHASPADWGASYGFAKAVVLALNAELQSIIAEDPELGERIDQVFDKDVPLLRVAMGVDAGEVYRPRAAPGEAPEVLLLGSPVEGAERELKKVKAGEHFFGFAEPLLSASVSERLFFDDREKFWSHIRDVPSWNGKVLGLGGIREKLASQNARAEEMTIIVAELPGLPDFARPRARERAIRQRMELGYAAYRTILSGIGQATGSESVPTDGEIYLAPGDFDVPAFYARVTRTWAEMCDGLAAVNLTAAQRKVSREHAERFPSRPLTELRLAAVKDTVVRVSSGRFGLSLMRGARWLGVGEPLTASLEVLRHSDRGPAVDVPELETLTYGKPLTGYLKGVTSGRHSNAQAIVPVISGSVRRQAGRDLVNAPRRRADGAWEGALVASTPAVPILTRRGPGRLAI